MQCKTNNDNYSSFIHENILEHILGNIHEIIFENIRVNILEIILKTFCSIANMSTKGA